MLKRHGVRVKQGFVVGIFPVKGLSLVLHSDFNLYFPSRLKPQLFGILDPELKLRAIGV